VNLKIHDDAEALGKAAAGLTETAAREAMEARGIFHLVLAGGRTPRICYMHLRDMDIDWLKVHVWFGDERCLPVDDPGRNDRMADEVLLNHVSIPVNQIHRIQAELGPERAAEVYALLVGSTVMDMVHLGMGEDGHVASLFPGHPTLADPRPVVPVFDAPKPPPERVSLGFPVLNAARQKVFMVTGAGKRHALHRIMSGESLPAAMVQDALWLVDRRAAGES
jgi:6-phosphogluconolactonase